MGIINRLLKQLDESLSDTETYLRHSNYKEAKKSAKVAEVTLKLLQYQLYNLI